MKKVLKLSIFPLIAIVLVALAFLLPETDLVTEQLNAQEAEGSDGVLYADYFTGNSAHYDWQFGDTSHTTKKPTMVNDAMLLDGFSGSLPAYAILKYTLPEKCDIYFTAEVSRYGEGEGREPAVFLNVGEKFGTRYMLWLRDGSVMLTYNNDTALIQKKVEGMNAGTTHSFRLALDGAAITLYVDGGQEPVFKFTGTDDYATIASARNLAIYGRACEFYFDDLVITDGKNLIPVEELAICGQGGSVIEGIGTQMQMKLFMSPYNATDRGVVWSVDDESVATITTNGLLTAKKYGKVTVSARTRDGSGIAATCQITVTKVTGAEEGDEVVSPYNPGFLADEYEIVYKSDDPLYLYPMSPFVVPLESGRLIATFDLNGDHVNDRIPYGYEENPNWIGQHVVVAYSDDEGKTWNYSLERPGLFARVFEDGGKVYLIYRADAGMLNVAVSEDDGLTWSEGSVIDRRSWHSAPTGIIRKGDCLYMTMELSVNGSLAPILIRAKSGTDLTKAENWSFSQELSLMEIVKDARREDLDYTGIMTENPSADIRWLEGNLFQIYDPEHPWYDPTMSTFYVYSRLTAGRAGYAGLLKITENADGTMTASAVEAESGNMQLLVALPGGNDKFSMLYDEESGLYWLASNLCHNSIIDRQYANGDQQGHPMHERDRLALWFSKDALNWEFAGMISEGETEKESRSYPYICVDGDDILVVTRCGTADCNSSHDNDILSFHRIKDFRDLVY